MIRYLTLREALEIHRRVMELSSGAVGVRELKGLKSALAQPEVRGKVYLKAYKTVTEARSGIKGWIRFYNI